jgi:SAM-dependent methyltransferase
MISNRDLPQEFHRRLRSLEKSYLEETDPIRQSGFGGGSKRWREEREPILKAVTGDGDFLDIGCANGHLLECLVAWAEERDINLTPYGMDTGYKLIELAKKRMPEYSDNFFVGNAWDWKPSRKYRYVYSLNDCVPEDFLEEYVHRLLSRTVIDGGRLIIGAYGSRSQKTALFDIDGFLTSRDFAITGMATGGHPPVTMFVWIDK